MEGQGNDLLDFIMQMRQRAGAQGQQDDPIHGPSSQVMEGLRHVLGARMQQGRQMPLPQDVYMDLAKRAGMEEDAKKRAAAIFAQSPQYDPGYMSAPLGGQMLINPLSGGAGRPLVK